MPLLSFPTDRIVGTVDYVGSWSDDRGPVLARGSVVVPDGVQIGLHLRPTEGAERVGGGEWSLPGSSVPLNLDFVTDLPPAAISSLALQGVDEHSFAAIGSLAPGLRQLNLIWTGFSDGALSTVARLTALTGLQTFGNRFTDAGVQQLVALQELESLSLEEESLTIAAFDFVVGLPKLQRLGVQDVNLGRRGLRRLRDRLPRIRVSD